MSANMSLPAWSAGMIHSGDMQLSIDRLIGNVIGNTSQVDASPSNSGSNNVGGGYDLTQIYRRDYLANRTEGYRWYGHPIGAGMPLPGNYSGFAGTLAQGEIRISNAFMTGFLWFLILLGLLVGFVIALKWFLELLSACRLIKRDRLKFFRNRWTGYVALVALRTCFVSFFLIMFLTIFEFSLQSSVYVKLVAAAVFLIFVAGLAGIAVYACYYKALNIGRSSLSAELKDLLQDDPSWFAPSTPTNIRDAEQSAREKRNEIGSVRNNYLNRRSTKGGVEEPPYVSRNTHDNNGFTTRFGWLASRYRRTRWWFFTAWLSYEFLRAVFYAGASGYPRVQVFGLVIVESLAFAYVLWARPFEGRRSNFLVSCTGFSKVASVALSASFDVHFNLPRITTTVLGIAIIAIQGVLTIMTLIAIVIGAFTSYMSVSRGCEEFRPKKWHGLRERYFDHLDRVVDDLPEKPKPKKKSEGDVADTEEQTTGFEVMSIRRVAKIEDEDEEFAFEMRTQAGHGSRLSVSDRPDTPTCTSDTIFGVPRSATATLTCRSRAGSLQSLSRTQLPSRARPYKPSWSARDFNDAGMLAINETEDRSRSMERAAFDNGPAQWLASTCSKINKPSPNNDIRCTSR